MMAWEEEEEDEEKERDVDFASQQNLSLSLWLPIFLFRVDKPNKKKGEEKYRRKGGCRDKA